MFGRYDEDSIFNKITKGKVISAIVVIVAIISLLSMVEVVDAGHKGIQYSINGGVKEDTLTQGWHLVSPMIKVTDFPTYVQNVNLTADSRGKSETDESFFVPSKDGKQVRVGVEMNYRFEETKLPMIWNKFGGKTPRQIEDYHIKGKMKAWTAEVTAEFPIIDLYGEKRTEASQKALTLLQGRFEQDGIIVESFNFVSLTPDENSLSAIQDRVDAQQRLETAKIEQKKSEVESETKIMLAEASAKERKIQAEAEKVVNDLMQQSVTKTVLEREWIKKWDGKLPTVQSGTGSGVIMNMNGLSKE